MIRIDEIEIGNGTVEIKVDGVLDRKSKACLDMVYRRCLRENKIILLNLEGVTHVTREGRDYIRAIRDTVSFTELPCFLRLC